MKGHEQKLYYLACVGYYMQSRSHEIYWCDGITVFRRFTHLSFV